MPRRRQAGGSPAHVIITDDPDSASQANAESPRGFIGQENVPKTGVTINPHVTSQPTKEMTDDTSIKGDAQMHATMDP